MFICDKRNAQDKTPSFCHLEESEGNRILEARCDNGQIENSNAWDFLSKFYKSEYENLDHRKSEIFKQLTFRFLPYVKYKNIGSTSF